jgi:hypothetical protein
MCLTTNRQRLDRKAAYACGNTGAEAVGANAVIA